MVTAAQTRERPTDMYNRERAVSEKLEPGRPETLSLSLEELTRIWALCLVNQVQGQVTPLHIPVSPSVKWEQPGLYFVLLL